MLAACGEFASSDMTRRPEKRSGDHMLQEVKRRRTIHAKMMIHAEDTLVAAGERLHEAYLRKRNTYEAEKEELALIDANLSSAVHELRCCGRETEQRHNELCQRQSMMDAAEAESSRMEPASLMAQGLLDALRPEGTRADGDAVQRMVDALQEEGMEASLAAVAPEVLQKAPSGRQGFELKAEEHLRKFARELHGRFEKAQSILDDQRVALEHAKSAMKNASKAEQQAAERVDGIKKTYEDQKDKLNILREAMIEAEEEALCFDGLLEQVGFRTPRKEKHQSDSGTPESTAPGTPTQAEEMTPEKLVRVSRKTSPSEGDKTV
ncbi:unnamed protein product [Durusdinium trenchii]|uniref:Uncharacterized protein n=1 Tax=Durusdinium trenchii TaxID=1381693 RepID=A0ABP0LU25_9DINO